MTAQYHFIEPVDVLFLRGNKLFGEAGSYGESLVPPWPSVAAGAMRSALLARKKVDLSAFANGDCPDPELGTPRQPGTFALTAFHLARRCIDSDSPVEPLYQLPADLVVRKHKNDDGSSAEDSEGMAGVEVEYLQPREPSAKISCSKQTPLLAVLPEKSRGKPQFGYWLNRAGWANYLAGQPINVAKDLVKSSALWAMETRVGVGLDAASRRAADGALFSTQVVSLNKAEHGTKADHTVGFLAESVGAKFPDGQFGLRLGGDGRAAIAHAVKPKLPAPDYQQIADAGCCRLVLASPGIFEHGWLPTGVSGDIEFSLHGVRGRLHCAAVPRAETVSGFDIAKRMPKPARRAAPTGSVYWLKNLEASPEALRKLAEEGLWSTEAEDPVRRAEGFNRLAIAACCRP